MAYVDKELQTAFTHLRKTPAATITILNGTHKSRDQVLFSIELGFPFKCWSFDWCVHFVEWIHGILEQGND